MAPGATVTATGLLKKKYKVKRPVRLEVQQDGSWVAVAAGKTTKKAGYTLRATAPRAAGAHRFRVHAPKMKIKVQGKVKKTLPAVTTPSSTVTVAAPPPDPPPPTGGGADVTPPPVPGGLTAEPGDAKVDLAWVAVTGPTATDLSGYIVYRAAAPSGPWTRITPDVLTSTAHSATQLVNGTSYAFAVAAVDTAGNESARSTAASATPLGPPPVDTTPPPTPAGLNVVAGDEEVVVGWTPIAGADAADVAGYTVYQATGPDGPWDVVTSPPVIAANTWTVSPLSNDVAYWFSVSATDLSGNQSENALPVSGSPVAGPSEVSTLVPTSGRSAGGEDVVLTGSRLDRVSSVKFGDLPGEVIEQSRSQLVVRTPARVAGEVAVRLVLDSGDTVTAGESFTFTDSDVPSHDEVTPASGTVVLEPAEVRSVDVMATGDLEVVLEGLEPLLAPGSGLYLQPGHPDASTGLAARVRAVEVVEGRTVLDVRQAPLDSVLSDRHFSGSATFADPARSLRRLAPSATQVLSVNRSWLDCRKVVQHEGGYETLEPLPENSIDVQVRFTIADLQADVIDRGEGGDRYYEASVSGSPTLEIVARAESAAKCQFKPALVDKLEKKLTTPVFTLGIKPDLSVTFRVSGKAVITKRTTFITGVRKAGAADPEFFSDFRQDPANVKGSAEVGIRIRAGADLSLLYKGIVGLSAKIGPVADLSYRYDAAALNHCVKLGFDIEMELGARLDLVFAEWTQPLLSFTQHIVDEETCTVDPGDPDTSLVLDPGVGDDPLATYIMIPDTSSTSPFPVGAFEPVNYGDAYILRRDITLEAGKNYWFTRPLSIPDGVSLTIEPGAHLKLGHCLWTIWWPPGSCISVDGGLVTVSGTSAEPVVITRLSDDSLDGNTDGVDPSQSMSGIAPLTVSRGVLVMRGVDMRWAGLSVGGGTVTVENSRFRHSGIVGAPAALRVDRVHFDDTAGQLRLDNGGGTVSRSRFDAAQVTIGGGAWDVHDNQFIAGSITNNSPDLEFRRNAFITEGVTLAGSVDGASATYEQTVTATGEPPVLTVKHGTVTGAATWGSPLTYLIEQGVHVPEGTSLTLPAGTVIKGHTTYNVYQSFPSYLQVDGTLRALGTAERPVVLTSRNDATAGADTSAPASSWMNGDSWAGIRVGDRGVIALGHTRLTNLAQSISLGPDTTADLHSLRLTGTTPWNGAIVSWSEALLLADAALESGASLVLNGGDPRVERTSFQDGQVRVLTERADLVDLSFDRSDPYGIVASPTGAGAEVQASRAGGGPIAVTVEDGSVSGNVQWSGGHTYLLTGVVTVPAQAVLTLGPGTVVKGHTTYSYSSSYGSAFRVHGELHAPGTAATPVRLVSRNSPAGGETAVAPTQWMDGNTWAGVSAHSGGLVDLDHVIADGARAFLSLDPGTVGRISHLDLTDADSGQPPLYSASSDLVIEHSSFMGRGDYDRVGLRIDGAATLNDNAFTRASVVTTSSQVVMHGNRFHQLLGVRLSNHSEGMVDAERNWWGSADGPVMTGPTPTVTGNVDADPWCEDVACEVLSAPG